MMRQQSLYLLPKALRSCLSQQREQPVNHKLALTHHFRYLTTCCARTKVPRNDFLHDQKSAANFWRYLQRTEYSKLSYINTQNAQELICNLTDNERDALKEAIAKYDAFQMKKNFEGQLAAIQWRTRFGRLTRVPALGDVDPTGSFCAVPDDWLRKKLVENAKPPSNIDLAKIFFVNAVPFLVFGFLDNFTMIVAGEYIEDALRTFMPVSTMAAAGLGNTVSDILGLSCAVYVERACEFMGLKPPKLTPAQFDLKSSRRASNWGRLVGITLGCIIGMWPLLFVESKTSEPCGPEDADPTPASDSLSPSTVKI